MYDSDGWVVGSVANLTYLDNRYLDNVGCVNGTERRLFRSVNDVPDYAVQSNVTFIPPRVERNFTLSVEVAYGALDAFPKSVETDRIAISDEAYRVEDVSVVWPEDNIDDDELQCFTENQLKSLNNISSVILSIICQNTSTTSIDGIVDFLVIGTHEFDFSSNVTTPLKSDDGQSSTTQNASVQSVEIGTATLIVSSMFLISRMKFPHNDEPLFTAADIANVDFFTPLPLTPLDFEQSVQRLMYIKQDNLTVSAQRDERETVTVLDTVFVVVAAAEVALVLIFATAMFVIGRIKLKGIEMPTTLNGLSQCWAHGVGKGRGGKYVCLKMTGDKDSKDGRYLTSVQ